MAELDTDGPKGWTPAVEKNPKQQKLRAKVDENIAERTAYRRFSAPKRLVGAREGLTSLVEEIGQTIHREATKASSLLTQAALVKKVVSMPDIQEVGTDYFDAINRTAEKAGRKPSTTDPIDAVKFFIEAIKGVGDESQRQGEKVIEEAKRKVADLGTQANIAQRRVKKLEPDEEYHREQYWQMKGRGRTPQELEIRRQAREGKELKVSYGKADKRI